MPAPTSVASRAGARDGARGRESRRGGQWTHRAGLALVVAGAVMLAWIAWATWGTDVVSGRRHHEVVGQLERAWASPAPAPADGEAGGGAVRTAYGTAGAILRIPAFGDDYAVPVIDGVGEEALASGVGRFEGSADPGGEGNYTLAGHRVTHGGPLRDLPDLDPGDEVVVETRQRSYTYVLDGAGDGLRVPFTAGWVLAPHPRDPYVDRATHPGAVQPSPDSRRLLTLTTCAELFHTDDRLVVFGHLVSVEDRSSGDGDGSS